MFHNPGGDDCILKRGQVILSYKLLLLNVHFEMSVLPKTFQTSHHSTNVHSDSANALRRPLSPLESATKKACNWNDETNFHIFHTPETTATKRYTTTSDPSLCRIP